MALTTLQKKHKKQQADVEQQQQMLEVMQEQNRQLMTLMGKMLDQIGETAKAQRVWFELFKPPTQPQKSTSLEEREEMKSTQGNPDAWTEVDAQKFIRELGLLSTVDGDEDGVVF